MSGNENDNKIVQSDRASMPANGGEEFTDRPPHQRNRTEGTIDGTSEVAPGK